MGDPLEKIYSDSAAKGTTAGAAAPNAPACFRSRPPPYLSIAAEAAARDATRESILDHFEFRTTAALATMALAVFALASLRCPQGGAPARALGAARRVNPRQKRRRPRSR